MEDPSESASLRDEGGEKEAETSPYNSKVTEIHPLAFTIEFDDQKFDESKKSKVRERLSAFSLKHKRNPSLPDFREVRNTKISPPVEKIISLKSVSFQHVPEKKPEKSGKTGEIQWKSTPLKAAKNLELKSSLSHRGGLGVRDSFVKASNAERRYSLDGSGDAKPPCQNDILSPGDSSRVVFKMGASRLDDEMENKSDTVSEAGTYTVDKDENVENDGDRTRDLGENEEFGEEVNGVRKSYQSSWIKDWVRDVEKQNMLNLGPKESSQDKCSNVEMENGSCCISKIPSPLNTLKKAKPRCMKFGGGAKPNGSAFHKRSSSLGAKENNENHGSESSLETESFLRATESAMTSIQNRMKLALERRSPDLRRVDKRIFNYKERPHPPSTASDTDTNSENDAKVFKKPIGNPFTSARLNRAFSLRRAKAEPGKEFPKPKSFVGTPPEGNGSAKQAPKAPPPKPPSSSPFSRLDCGRFSMRSTLSGTKTNVNTSQPVKKDTKKPNTGNRSSSSLSSREVEFQNWRRRKSFDPMKAAAEGRKKELAKKAAGNAALTQSVNLGNAVRARSSGEGNPVLRSASFHSTAQVLGAEEDAEEVQEESTDEQDESASSSWLSNRRSRPNNSPSQHCVQCKPKSSTPLCSSRSSLVSETHSSPSRRLKSNDLENLVLSAICDSSYKLKSKSCKLLKKLNYLYDPGEEKSFRLKEEVTILESGPNSAKTSPVHQPSSRDLFAILKNLKGVENAFNVLEDVLFDENLEIYFRE